MTSNRSKPGGGPRTGGKCFSGMPGRAWSNVAPTGGLAWNPGFAGDDIPELSFGRNGKTVGGDERI